MPIHCLFSACTATLAGQDWLLPQALAACCLTCCLICQHWIGSVDLRQWSLCVQADLVQRLAEALQAAEKLAAEEKVVGVKDALANVAEAAVKAEGGAVVPKLAPGTQHVGRVLSAKVGNLLMPCTTCLACCSFIIPCALGISYGHLLQCSPCVALSAVWCLAM